jgi:uncharacterized protein YbaP (TraB family)
MLKSTDYPLPPEYNRAFDASSRLVFEAEPKSLTAAGPTFLKAGKFPKGDTLKNHVDPRTYDYLRRFFGRLNVPEEKFAQYRPWLIAMMLQASGSHGFSVSLGVESFLTKRARANGKAIEGLESLSDGVAIFSTLSDRESEAMLLLTFIPAEGGSGQADGIRQAWRRGDADTVTRISMSAFQDFPSLADRLIITRNQNWMSKIERYAQSKQPYFVVVGTGHMGGPNGLLAMLRSRGYQIEQI